MIYFHFEKKKKMLQVSDARRAYETKAESKPAVFPALKVSDAKKAFEVAAAAALAASSPTKATASNHNSLPRRTLIQTPVATTNGYGPEQRHSLSNHNSQRSSIASEDNDKYVLVYSSFIHLLYPGPGFICIYTIYRPLCNKLYVLHSSNQILILIINLYHHHHGL